MAFTKVSDISVRIVVKPYHPRELDEKELDLVVRLVREDLEYKTQQLSECERKLYEPFMRWSDEVIIRYIKKVGIN